jgi:hypothetical protein
MARIRGEDFSTRISTGDFSQIMLRGLQDGSFCLLLECGEDCFILENNDGSVKSYNNLHNVLSWLKRKTAITEVIVSLELWRHNQE